MIGQDSAILLAQDNPMCPAKKLMFFLSFFFSYNKSIVDQASSVKIAEK